MHGHNQIGLNFIVNVMLIIVKDKISTKIVTIQAIICRDFSYDVSYNKVWVAKEKVLE